MKKVCFLQLKAYAAFSLNNKTSIGGTQIQLVKLAKELAKRDFGVFFVVGDFGQKNVEIYDNITIYKTASLKRTPWHLFAAPFLIWKCLKASDADIYITSAAGAETGILALFCKIYKKKMVYRIAHEIDCNGEFIKQHWLVGKMFLFGLHVASTIIAQTKTQRKFLEKTHGLNSIVIRNFLDIDTPNLVTKKNIILWVGRCEKSKNPLLFLNLAEIFPKENFTMIAPRQNHQPQLFEQVLSQTSSIKNLNFIEFVPPNKIQEYFEHSKVFIGTSESEGFPNTYLEACSAGTPIISYRVNPDNFINKNGLGYIANGNFAEMVSSLSKLLTDHEDWQKKSENAHRYVKKNHDLNANVAKWIEMINF
jgi:glycosyltransferase involved in cell wall biosynthesis